MRPGISLICWLSLVVLVACGPVVPGLDDTGAGSSTTLVVSTSEAPTTGEASTTAVLTTGAASGSTGLLVGTGSSTSETDTGAFIHPKDGQIGDPCNPFEQDCPAGMKCMPYADDGGGSWNNVKCVPVVEDPKQLGEPCFAVGGGVSGFDDCDLGFMCWDVDAENQGICVELCKGSPEEGICEAPKTVCAVFADGYLALCLAPCNPVLQDCDPSDVCIENPGGGSFLCVLDASGDEGQLHDPCMFANACDPGLQCVESAWAVECDQMAEMCCEPFCDITSPNSCPGVGQECTAYFDEGTAPPGCENVGFCRVPM